MEKVGSREFGVGSQNNGEYITTWGSRVNKFEPQNIEQGISNDEGEKVLRRHEGRRWARRGERLTRREKVGNRGFGVGSQNNGESRSDKFELQHIEQGITKVEVDQDGMNTQPHGEKL
jgi:hypothetical protein